MSEKVFKKILKDFEARGRPSQRSLKQETNKAKVKAPKTINTAQKSIMLPYGLMTKPSHFEPSNGLDSLAKTYRHRVGRLNDWHNTYGQGMYE